MPAFNIEKLLLFLVDNGGSDMILTVNAAPTIRVNGDLKPISKNILSKEDTASLMKSVTPEKNQKELAEVGSTDYAITFSDKATFRVSAFRQQGVIAMVLRQIPNRILSFEELGLPPMVSDQALRPRGLFLVTGPTGSGKTTTLATVIHHINSTMPKHIITIEDPVEFRHRMLRSVITHREVGTDVPSFSEALRRALRQDPDVILIGEMRDLETISIALSAAETGHLVLATLHTNSAAETITRIVDAFPPDQQEMIRIQLAGVLNIVICQTLCKKIGDGRVPSYEIMKVTSGIRNQIRENKIQQIPSSIQVSGNEGNILMDDHLYGLFTNRRITEQEMMEKCHDARALETKIKDWKAEQEAIRKKQKRG